MLGDAEVPGDFGVLGDAKVPGDFGVLGDAEVLGWWRPLRCTFITWATALLPVDRSGCLTSGVEMTASIIFCVAFGLLCVWQLACWFGWPLG